MDVRALIGWLAMVCVWEGPFGRLAANGDARQGWSFTSFPPLPASSALLPLLCYPLTFSISPPPPSSRLLYKLQACHPSLCITESLRGPTSVMQSLCAHNYTNSEHRVEVMIHRILRQ